MAASLHNQFAANAASFLTRSTVYATTYAPERPFLTELVPGLSRADLADAIIGCLSAKIKCSKTVLDVLRVLICYTRGNHDRVWTSYVRIMLRGEKYIPGWKKCCLKTIQRAIHVLIRLLLIKRIDDPLEKFSGPGEQQWIDEGNEKLGDGPVNHYVLSNLKDHVPAWAIQAFEALIGGGHFTPPPAPTPFVPIDVEAEMGDPFDEAQEDVRQAKRDAREKKRRSKIGFRALVTRTAAGRARAEQELADNDPDFADPFSDSVSPEKSRFSGQASENSIPPTSLLETFDIAGGTPAKGGRNVEMSLINSNENRAEKAHSEGAADIPIDVTKLSPIGNRYGGGRTGANITANERSQGEGETALGNTGKAKEASPRWLAKQPPEVQELARRGVSGWMARKIYNELGEAWVRAVLVYGRRQEGRDGDRKAGPWYTQVYKGFKGATPGKPASFPDDDQVFIDRNERAHQEASWAAERAERIKEQQQRETEIDAKEAALPGPLPGWIAHVPDGLLGAPVPDLPVVFPAPPPKVEPPSPAPEQTPIEETSADLAAVWPAVLKEAETCFNRVFFLTHIKTLAPGAYTKPEPEEGRRGMVTFVTDGQFTYGSWNEKPQHRGTLTSVVALALGIAPGELELRFTPVRPTHNAGGRNG